MERPSTPSPGLRRRQWLAFAAAVSALPAAAARREQRFLFGSPVQLLLDPAAPPSAVHEVWRGLESMNARWNAWKPGEVSELNRAVRQRRTTVIRPQLGAMIRACGELEALSGGLFNPAIGALVAAWGFHADVLTDGPQPPPARLRRCVEARPSVAHLRIDGARVWSTNPAVQLDFGAYAKGVALDWALDRLQRAGVEGALLDLGGNLAAMGLCDGRPWSVGVRDPQGPGLIAAVALRAREAVVTSGTYERHRNAGGVRVSHIIDPRTGLSSMGTASVTVIHPSAARADAAATALSVAGRQRWRDVAWRMGIDQVLVVHADGAIEWTAPMAQRVARMA